MISLKTSILRFYFAICVWIVCICREEDGCLSSSPKEQWVILLTIWQHFILTALQSDSQYFLVFPPPDCTFLEIDALLLESLDIARLFLDSIAYLAT